MARRRDRRTRRPDLDDGGARAGSTPPHPRPASPAGGPSSPRTSPTPRRLSPGAPWGPGPHADAARDAVRRHLGAIEVWTARYHDLAGVARDRGWVATHGEPGGHNQLVTAEGRILVDWESSKLAPAERDLRTLVDAGVETDADPAMLELFDLEWRLDEVSQYTAWFAAPHAGTADDEIAFAGLLEELERE